jgi:hypothetical protein
MSNFAPIDVDGFGSFSVSAEPAGWYQLATPAATLPTIPGITVPEEAQGFLLQATTALQYCCSPGSTGTNPDPLQLPAGGTIFLSGQTWVRGLCILVGATTAFSITFCTGSQDPIPKIS